MNKVKKILILLLITIMIVTTFGCSKSDQSNSYRDTSDSKTSVPPALDAENLTFYNLGHPITETEDGYFILLNGFLHYLDKETDTFVLFSNDSLSPEELLDLQYTEMQKEDGKFTHEAYFSGATDIYYHDNKLYTLVYIPDISSGSIDNWDLIETNPTTHERKILASYKNRYGQFVILENKIFLLDQEIYRADGNEVSEEDVMNGKGVQFLVKYRITGYDLEKSQLIEPFDVEIPDKISLYDQTIPQILGYKDKMLISISYNTDYDETGKPINSEPDYEKQVWFEYDINTNKLKEIIGFEYPSNLEKNNNYQFISNYTYFNNDIYYKNGGEH